MRPLGYRREPGWRIRIPILETSRARFVALLCVTVVLLALEAVVAATPGLYLDLGALVIVYLALESPPLAGAFVALFVGYLADVFSGESRGLSAASMVICFLAIRLVVVRFTGARWLMITAISVIATALVFLVRIALEGLFGPGLSTLHAMTPAVSALMIGAVIFGYPCYRFLRAIDERFKPREDAVPFGSTISRREWE